MCIASLGTPEQAPFLKVLPAKGYTCEFVWLQGCPRLVAKAVDALAVVQIEPSVSAVLQPEWTELAFPEPVARDVDSCLSPLPAGHVMALRVSASQRHQDRLVCEFLVYTSQLQLRSSRRTVVANHTGMDLSELSGKCRVAASQHTVAVQLGILGTWLYQLKGPDTIGRLVSVVPKLETLCYNSSGHFLAGSLGSVVCVLDGRTGAFLLRMSPAGPDGYWPGKWGGHRAQHGRYAVIDLRIAGWGGERHSQLLLMSRFGPAIADPYSGDYLNYPKHDQVWTCLQF